MFFEINKIFLKDEIFNQYKILTKEDPIETQKNRLLKPTFR